MTTAPSSAQAGARPGPSHPRAPRATPQEAPELAPLAGAPLWIPGAPLTRSQLARLAEEQHGILTLAQCRDGHLSERQLAHRVASGRWTRPHRGVYLTVPGRESFLTRATAALLACGTDAALSHGAAAYLYGLANAAPRQVDVTIPADRRIAEPVGVRVHRSAHVRSRTHELLWPWRTTVEHTVFDLAQVGDLDAAIALNARACSRRLTTPRALGTALAARPRQRHATDLREILAEVQAGRESPLEVRFARDVLAAHRLPAGVAQHSIGTAQRHDVAFPDLQLIVELDGRLGHEGADGRHTDARRDRRASGRGWLTIRATWRDVAGTSCQLASELAAVMTVRGWSGRARVCRRRGCVAASVEC